MTDKYVWEPHTRYCVVLFYKYCAIEDVPEFQELISAKLHEYHLLGRILLASEGINGTVSGSEVAVVDFVAYLSSLHGDFSTIDWKYSYGEGDHLPFFDCYVRIVEEIISTGKPKALIDANSRFDASYGGLAGGGTHLSPEQFHAALDQDPQGVILDIRNDVEYDIGHFKNAVGLSTFTYADTWDRIDEVIQQKEQHREATSPNYYLYCTGGIRCEKASVYLKAKGIHNVYQLEGGIHRYLESYPSGGLFEGKNFVFDNRVAMTGSDGSHESVVGQCLKCHTPYDTYSGRIVCTVCRVPVLLCPECVAATPVEGEYHCKKHWNLREMYFTVLERFDKPSLELQAKLLLEYENSLMGKNCKSKRRMLHKQRQRVLSRLEVLNESSGDCSVSANEVLVNPQHRVGIKAGGIWRE